MKATDGSGLRRRVRGFAPIPNETIWLDPPLSSRALGVLTKLVALPQDWDLRMEWLIRQFPEGRDAIQTAVRELRRRGFYRVERRRRGDGTFTSGVSISDVVVPEWVDLHADACQAQDTDKPRWDVSLRVHDDGRLEDEPIPPSPPAVTDGDDPDAGTVDGFPVNGGPVTGGPVTGFPPVKEKTYTHTDTQGGTSGGSAQLSRGPVEEPPTTPAAQVPPLRGGPDDDPEPPARCARPHPPVESCGQCREARVAHQAWADRAAIRRRSRDEAERAAQTEAKALTRAEVAACRLCGADGFVSVAGGRVRCTHNPSTTTGQGRAAFAAALDELRARPRTA